MREIAARETPRLAGKNAGHRDDALQVGDTSNCTASQFLLTFADSVQNSRLAVAALLLYCVNLIACCRSGCVISPHSFCKSPCSA